MSNENDDDKDELEAGFVSGEPRTSMSDAELKKLALDVQAGAVFGTWNLRDQANETGMVFMPIMLLDAIQVKQLQIDGVVHLYEYIHKASPRSVNGYPMFMSFGTLNADETTRLQAHIKVLQDMEKAFMGDNANADADKP